MAIDLTDLKEFSNKETSALTPDTDVIIIKRGNEYKTISKAVFLQGLSDLIDGVDQNLQGLGLTVPQTGEYAGMLCITVNE